MSEERTHIVVSMELVEYYRHMCHCFVLFCVVFIVHQQQDPILTHYNRVRTDSTGGIKEPVSGCGQYNTPLSLLCQDRALEQTKKLKHGDTKNTDFLFRTQVQNFLHG